MRPGIPVIRHYRGQRSQEGEARTGFVEVPALELLGSSLDQAFLNVPVVGNFSGRQERGDRLAGHLFRQVPEHLRHPCIGKRDPEPGIDYPYPFQGRFDDPPVPLPALPQGVLGPLPIRDIPDGLIAPVTLPLLS